jgi:hypothetical protein
LQWVEKSEEETQGGFSVNSPVNGMWIVSAFSEHHVKTDTLHNGDKTGFYGHAVFAVKGPVVGVIPQASTYREPRFLHQPRSLTIGRPQANSDTNPEGMRVC